MSNNCTVCCKEFNQRSDIMKHIKSKKHLSHFNIQQTKIIKRIDDLGDTESILINAAGGTGKTFTVSSVLTYYKNVVALGPTHQSVQILKKKFKSSFTFHAFFNWCEDVDEKGNTMYMWGEPSIKPDTIFVLDEVSMMSDYMYSLYCHYIKGQYRTILMGDIAQLEPVIPFKCSKEKIEKGEGSFVVLPKGVKHIKQQGNNSLFFQDNDYTHNISLTVNMRANNKGIADFVNTVRNETIKDNYIDLTNCNFNKKLTEEFLKKIKFLDFMIICHSNKEKDDYNKKIRKLYYPDTYKNEINEGDKMIVKTYNNQIFHTSYRFTVKSFIEYKLYIPFIVLDESWNIEPKEGETFNCIKIITTDNETTNKICENDKKDFNLFMSKQRTFINSLKIQNLINFDSDLDEKQITRLKDQIKQKKRTLHRQVKLNRKIHCEIDFSFASTVHKAQGIGIDNIIVHNSKSVYFKNKSKYTAVSRAIENLYIVDPSNRLNYNYLCK